MDYKNYLQHLKKHTRYDFSGYSDNSIHRRIQKVLTDHHLNVEQLIEKTKYDQLFVEKMVEEITVNTTELFRNPEVWIDLYHKYKSFLKNKKQINIWHAGCSSGQEVYSNLIILNELGLLDRVKIVGTDLNIKMLSASKKGRYNYKFNRQYIENFNKVLNSKKNGSPKVPFEKYFTINEQEDCLEVNDFLRAIPLFRRHDLVQEKIPFYNKFDVIFCRNVLIYFNAELQSKIIQQFYNQLFVGGIMILGNHEGINGFFKTKFLKNGPAFVKNNAYHLKY
ncbi:protein-glutamate O-methyltransferase CheR [Marinilabiliaceae bacterium JC017]|nr:protein-glutamate O-methyltransferase CheR [Marinilabiliaceae bacterium JC017]